MSNLQKNQRGVVAIIVAVMLMTLIAFLGLAVDSGYMFMKKNELQNAADAVALTCLIKNNITACGTSALPTNSTPVTSYTDITPVLTPVIPPGNIADYVVLATYPFSLCPSSASLCSKASVSTNFTPFFMSIFGFSNISLSASAVAAKMGTDCIIVLQTLGLKGTPDILGPTCNIRMGASSTNGNANQVAANNYIYNGHPPSDCGSHCVPSAISIAGAVPLPPLMPNAPIWDATATSRSDPQCKNATCNLLPGYYPAGIDCSGAKANCLFAGGKYYLDGPLNLASNNGQSSGTGVFFYMRGTGSNGNVDINAGGMSSLTAFGTSVGTCATTNNQLLIYSPNSNSGQAFSLKGNIKSSLVGNIYLNGYDMTWKGGNDVLLNGTLVVRNFSQNGNNSLSIDPTYISCNLSSGAKIYLIQ